MKQFNVSLLLLVLFASGLLLSCDSESRDVPFLSIEETTVNVPMASTIRNVLISTNVEDWTAAVQGDASSWLTAQRFGSEVRLTFTANEYLETRIGIVLVTADSFSETITVTQTGMAPVIRVSSNTKNVTADGGDFTLTITSNIEYVIVLPDDAEWLAMLPEERSTRSSLVSNEYHFTTTSNTTPLMREATIVVRCKEGTAASQYVRVVQAEYTPPPVIFRGVDLSGIYNLMIVAHPDDETLWGGKYLIEEAYGNFFVVVLTTDFARPVRVAELNNAMNHINNNTTRNNRWLKLPHRDSALGFGTQHADVRRDIEEILDFKDWNKVVTHNPVGEYTEHPWFGGVGNGHPQHVQTNQIVTAAATERDMLDILYVFVYHQPNTTGGLTPTVQDSTFYMIRHIIRNIYTHDGGLWGLFGHHIRFQEIVLATEWRR